MQILIQLSEWGLRLCIGKMVGTDRGDQRADKLKLQPQTTSQSDHMDHSLV